jgi:hypothetical protein
MHEERIIELTEEEQDKLVDDLVTCFYCHEPFKESDSLIPGIGLILGETDVAKYTNEFWHHGCIADWQKNNFLKHIRA